MGLFNRNKGKKQEESDQITQDMKRTEKATKEENIASKEDSLEAATTEHAKSLPHTGEQQDGRFTFMVEEIKSNEAGGVIVTGFVEGKIKTGDWFYIYHPSLPNATLKADFIEITPGEFTYYAENERASIGIQNIAKEHLPIFTVFSNIKAQTVIDVNQPIENPNLLGLLGQHPKFKDNPNYLNLLVFLAVHSNYLMAVYFKEEPELNEDGKVEFKKDTSIGFPCIPLQDGKRAVPAFTDWPAMTKWKGLFNEQHPPKTIIHRFSDIATISLNGNNGIAINPFGSSPIFLSNDMIRNIMSLDAYQKEFGNNNQQK